MQSTRPVAAQLHDAFLRRSETFIYHTAATLKHYEPIYLAWHFGNLEYFPLIRERDRYDISFRAGSLEHLLYYRLLKRRWMMDAGKAVRVLRDREARLIHAHFGLNGFAALELKKKTGIPLVTTFYGYDISELGREALWVRRYWRLFNEGDLFLVEGKNMQAKLQKLGCAPQKVRIHRTCIPVDSIAYKKRSAHGGNAVLMFAGRFLEKKGLIHALEALRALRRRRKDFEFRIIGNGPLMPEIESFIKQHAMQDYAKLLGFLNYREYLDQMAQADIFLHPSVTAANGDDEGGAPTTIIEAQAMGMPVIATRHADIPNVVVENESALLCEEKDAEALARNIEKMLEDRGSWEAMGASGRRFVETYHGLGAGVEQLENIYASLIEGKP